MKIGDKFLILYPKFTKFFRITNSTQIFKKIRLGGLGK